MNLIAGAIIGWVNDDWLVRIVAPFAWGLAAATRPLLLSRHRSDPIQEWEERRGGRSIPLYFFATFVYATSRALIGSVAVGAARSVFTI